jgi:hypothetical protein
VVSGVATMDVTATAATVVWTTNEPGDSQVEYGVTTAYGSSTPLDAGLATSHVVALSGLSASTTYHFRVISRDSAGNRLISPDFAFTTGAVTGGEGGGGEVTPLGQFGLVNSRATKLTFTDADGTVVTATLSGGGTAEAFMDGDHLGLNLTGTTSRSALSLVARRGTGDSRIKLGAVHIEGALAKLLAGAADLDGTFTCTGPIGVATLGRIISGELEAQGARVTFVDADGTVVTAAVVGGGTLTTDLVGSDVNIDVTGTGVRSSLIILARPRTGDSRVSLGNVRVAGALRGLLAPAADLHGTFAVAGSVGVATLGGIAGGTFAAAGGILGFGVIGTVTGGKVLAGLGLGSDWLLGGTGDAADTLMPAAIRKLAVTGSVTDSVFATGVNPTNGVFGDGDDVLAGGASSAILSLSVGSRGTVDAASRFAAGLFGRALISRQLVDTATDERFLLMN